MGSSIEFKGREIEEKNPLKQGLKPISPLAVSA